MKHGLVALVSAVACLGQGRVSTAQPAEAPRAAKVAWKRVDVAGAGISIEQHPKWAILQDQRLVYQRFSNEGAVSVRWGKDATIDDVLAHVGLGGGEQRIIESDKAMRVDGIAARRVKLRVISPEAYSHDVPPTDRERIFVFVGFDVGRVHVLVGYRSPASELAAVEPLLEHVLASVRKR